MSRDDGDGWPEAPGAGPLGDGRCATEVLHPKSVDEVCDAVRGQVRITDPDRMVIRMTDETTLKGVTSLPLFAGFLGLGLLALALGSTWWREGR